MQNLQHPYEEIFGEIRNILGELSNSDSYEDLLTKEDQLNELYQKFSFLKISNEFGFLSTANEAFEVVENQETNLDSGLISVEEFGDKNKVAEIIVEETEVHDIFDDVPEVEEVHSFKEIDGQESAHQNAVKEVSSSADVEAKGNEDEEEVHSEARAVDEVSGFAEIKLEENGIEEEIHSEEIQAADNETVEEVSSFAEIDSEEKELVEEVSNFAEIEPENNQVEEDIEIKEEFVSEIEDNLLQDNSQKLEPMQDSQFSFAMDREEIQGPKEDDYEARLAEKEAKLKELEEKRRQIVEFSRENTTGHEKAKEHYQSQNEDPQDKKFKLANIKGLKIAKSLFDDDHLEDMEQHPPKQDSGSLLKNNVPTDYMEAPKPKPEFKLDLNDRIAFSQHLFDGSQSELNQVVTVLNSFTSLDKAQEFLSDIYYERDWKKVDSYAQRLWTLVENRFL